MLTIQSVSLSLSLTTYVMSFILYAANFFNAQVQYKQVAKIFVIIAFIATSATVIIRTFETGHPPFSNMFEFALAFLWGMSLAFLVVEFKCDLKGLGMFFTPLVIGMLMWLLTMDQGTEPLMPALRSNWLYIHVFTAVIAYGAFAVSFISAIMYLLKAAGFFQFLLPALETLDNLTYKIISFAMPFMTLLIITGAIWAEEAWGSYWSWDPKETWSLITWLIYIGFLHARLIGKWQGKKSMWFAIIGFLAVLFTFAGVTYLLPGMHSYA